MDAVKFINELNRMCATLGDCSCCPLRNETCDITSDEVDANTLVTAVDKWSNDNPIKTRQSEFLKLFPNADMKDGCPKIFPCYVDKTIAYNNEYCIKVGSCDDCRREYWKQEVKNDKEK